MSHARSHVRKSGALLRGCAFAALLAAAAPAASAKPFELVYTGTFNSSDALNAQGAATDPFTGTTPFIVTALFDTSSPNLAGPVGVPGFVDYSPISATLTVGRDTYNFATYDQNPSAGITVAVYDDTTPFGPGHYAVGLLQNPLADGAGFIGDFLSASPTFSAANLTPTTFIDYQGVGYGSGVDPHNGQPPAVTPITLTDSSGHTELLTLGNYDENAGLGGVQNTAQIFNAPSPVPEASSVVSFGLLLCLGGGAFAVARRRKAGARG